MGRADFWKSILYTLYIYGFAKSLQPYEADIILLCTVIVFLKSEAQSG